MLSLRANPWMRQQTMGKRQRGATVSGVWSLHFIWI